ncbi:SRPBCC family protein [Tsukamurella tyrosinosolvens]|uniref:Ribosome association toxin PasT (RatA) of the RatAB toxin-antitoxin module n=1 Tax=Tsukamurella tyrosinosolvens TaxID=57704 RepID=A0A1H4R157_TSUTY|nr:SRPBCC family protein [Tsukamurella tyrosinosolvens]AUN40014.1 polyketide cyclase [Tsukamurella tyrosinosolvens]KXO91439.1 polyketide cyclase [Tsukamurella tyrosinosolvens]KXP05458.1 polyketide cyclase [Tsukamurella tyrosinosolvens]KZL95274.1 polyketide cyclase [Tsukamurella tyrosinosolvens]MCA4993990.1 SRPBCC family protein [Tsukamurella tyrosinosolvens]
MTTIHHTASASVPLSTAFAHVADYRTVPQWFFGISKFVPQGEKDYGLGATYDSAVKIGPKEIGSVVRVTEFEEDRLITLTSIAGFKTTSRWTFSAAGDNGTELAVEFTYELPGGLAGKALGMIIEPFAVQAVKASEAALRRDLEGAQV